MIRATCPTFSGSNAEKAETEQYKRNVEFGRSRLDFTDGVVDNLQVLVERLLFLGLTSIGNSSSGEVFTAEVEGLRDQIMNTMNSSVQGRFIFAGSATGSVTYQGNTDKVKLQVGRSVQLDTQIPGSELFGSTDVFSVITALDQAMQSGDRSSIDAELKNLQTAWDGLSVSRSRIGGLLNLADSTQNELTALALARETALVDIEAADLTKTLTEFRSLESALQNTLAIGARISQQTLLDYLR
jgi:flagellar hook-associated protein 3 FlgL